MLKDDLLKLVTQAKKEESHAGCVERRQWQTEAQWYSNSVSIMHFSLGLAFLILGFWEDMRAAERNPSDDDVYHMEAEEKGEWARVGGIILPVATVTDYHNVEA